MEKQWLAVYTQPRWEKKVHSLFVENGIESYCPLNTVVRQWSDRKKKVQEPLFKSYVFVRVSADEQTNVRKIAGVINFVYWLGKPAVIKESEIETIKRFMNDYTDVEVMSVDKIEPGSKLVINSGVLISHEGKALKVGNKMVEVLIESLGFKLVAKIEKDKLTLKK